jgi:hypothetical protein
MLAPLGRNSLISVHQGALCLRRLSHLTSRWWRRRAQLGDQHQDFLGHLSRAQAR